VPLLDHVLVETALRLPAAFKRRGEGTKPMLGAALHDLLPPIIRDRRDKKGFTFPFDVWIQQMPGLSASSNRDNWFDSAAVKRIWNLHEGGKMHWSRPWALAALSKWMDVGGA